MPKLEKFVTPSDTNLNKLIMEIAMESCKIYIIPTKLLKGVLKYCIPTSIKILNLPLNTGKFHEGWKSAVIRPLIKSLQKGTIKTNYRPVSNLSLISKILKKCSREQVTQHCNNYYILPSYQSAY